MLFDPPMKKRKPKITLDDVDSLSRGQPSRSKEGSRALPHRLTQSERIKLEVAKKRGYLQLPLNAPRDNLINIYKLWCQATNKEFIVKSHDDE
jgi:hypothetical protein